MFDTLCAKLLQLYLTLSDPLECSLPGSSVHRILQARILEWVIVPSSWGSFPFDTLVQSLSHVQPLATPMDCSLPDCSVQGILQARILEWVIMPSSRGSFPFDTLVQSLSHVQPLATPWTVVCQTALSKGFSRQEYWSGLPFPSSI